MTNQIPASIKGQGPSVGACGHVSDKRSNRKSIFQTTLHRPGDAGGMAVYGLPNQT